MGPEQLADQRNVHVVITHPGHVRGNHVHRVNTEQLTVHGPALVRYRVDGTDHDLEVDDREVVRVRFPPGVPHAILNTGAGPNVIAAFKDHPYDPDAPDTERVVLIETD